MSGEGYAPIPGSPLDEKLDRLLRLVVHMDGCVRRGGPSNYRDFLDPYDRQLLDEAFLHSQCRNCGGQGFLAEHAPGCEDNCERHGCPIQVGCSYCHGAGVESQVAAAVRTGDDEEPF